MSITWDAVPGATGYILTRKYSPPSSFPYFDPVQPDDIRRIYLKTNSYVDEGISIDAFAYYWVHPYKIVKGKLVVGNCPRYVYAKALPPPPKYIDIRIGRANKIALSWNGYAATYSIYRREGCTGSFRYIGVANLQPGQGFKFIDHTAKPWIDNFYRVFPCRLVNGKYVISGQGSQAFTYSVRP